jgi:cytochrome b561
MSARNTSVRYGSVAQFLHWAIVALLVVQVPLGKIAHELPIGLERLVMMSRHKSVGITILALALIRLAWRWFDRPPSPPPMPRWQEIAARLNHWALYAVLLALPLSGWLMSSAANRPVSWFGLAQLPDFIAPDAGLKETLEEVHEFLVNLLFVLVGLHVAAALKHQFIDRDGLLYRMQAVGRDAARVRARLAPLVPAAHAELRQADQSAVGSSSRPSGRAPKFTGSFTRFASRSTSILRISERQPR